MQVPTHHYKMTSYPTEIDLTDGKMDKAACELSSFRLEHLISLQEFINAAGERCINGGPLNIAIPKGDNDPNVLYTATSSGAKNTTCKSN